MAMKIEKAAMALSGSTPALRIAVVAPDFFGYGNRIKLACEGLGHQCLLLDERIGNNFMKKALTRLGIVQRIRAWRLAHVQQIAASLVEFRADRVLILNPETMTASDIRRLRERLPNARFVLYRWDSASKKATGAELISVFDRSYSFDPVDCAAIQGLEHLPLFHSHEYFFEKDTAPHRYAASFIGTGRIRRIIVLSHLARKLRIEASDLFFYLYAPSLLHYIIFRAIAAVYRFPGTVSRTSIAYDRYQDIIANTRVNVDVEQDSQNGLTIRTIEAVFTGSPLLTSNANVTRYDFWDAFPVAVFSSESATLPTDRTASSATMRELFHKYSIHRWLNTLIDEQHGEYFRSRPAPSSLSNEG